MAKSRRHLGLFALAATLVVAALTLPLGAARGVAQSTPGTAVLSDLFYRPLTVFSRGGRVTAVAGIPSDPQTYYMGSAGGVWKTGDAGETWEPMTDGQIGVGSIGAIAVADSNPNIVYVGTGSA